MPKMREFKFTGGEEPKTVEAMSYKKAVKSYQNNHDIKKYGNTGTRLERVKVIEHNKYDPDEENDIAATPPPKKEKVSETAGEEIPF